MNPREGDANNERAIVALEHRTADGAVHYDLMIEDPLEPAGVGRLLTWRMAQPPSRWRPGARIKLEAINNHRRDFLSYEGPLTHGRGTVRRVDSGTVRIEQWAEHSARVLVRMETYEGQARLGRSAGGTWILELIRRSG